MDPVVLQRISIRREDVGAALAQPLRPPAEVVRGSPQMQRVVTHMMCSSHRPVPLVPPAPSRALEGAASPAYACIQQLSARTGALLVRVGVG